ncbi:hypothetical protein MPH_02873 [Macrophomina phaseolina MS6]|uniref:PRISE-like Rossmann-fold domain-containing protein n=1 Tax=Macrophomina phaseolina (strain MS6) TaxID=1126212 RepID=K2SBM4_MACPH|nr:hypothetical protein MPH_02873 [Macrophomina phaseolina MS6]
MGHNALVFCGSGILEWVAANEILSNYPEKGTYFRVTDLTDRPRTREKSLWPESTTAVPALSILSGIDLTSGTVEDTMERLKERVPDIQTVGHFFYYAYKFHPGFPTETEIDLQMSRTGFGALEALAPKISYVVFPTGPKMDRPESV